MTTFQEYEKQGMIKKIKMFDIKRHAFCTYLAALDIQYSHHTPYIWTWCFDGTQEVIYGRTWDDLKQWINYVINALELSKEHKLVVCVEDLAEFFQYSKKILSYDQDPTVAKSPHEILLMQMYTCIQMHSYVDYTESDVDHDMFTNLGIIQPEIDKDFLSDICSLSENELEYSSNRVLYLSSYFREELNLKYENNIAKLPLTKTARVEQLIYAEMRRLSGSRKQQCCLEKQIKNINPMSSEEGMTVLLPMMHKAFFGGVNFIEPDTLDIPFEGVCNADLTSAYVSQMVLSKYPISKFQQLPTPQTFKQIFEDVRYNKKALLITFKVKHMELRPGAVPFLPSKLKNGYYNLNEEGGQLTAIKDTDTGARIDQADNLILVLTDIDFKLLFKNYKINGIRIIQVYGAHYGYLPDYITNVIVKLYHDKAKAKLKLQELERLGLADDQAEHDYDNIKSELARLYGIFTKSPYVLRYDFDTECKELREAEKDYVSKKRKYKPIVYQWGVWTTALVRAEIIDLRSRIKAADSVRVLSGDTDCVNFAGDATVIITDYNNFVKAKIARRCQQLGIDPEELQDLGKLTVKNYKRYKITGIKQYCFIKATENGDKFGYKVGGMNTKCKYFDKECSSPLKRFSHFGAGLTIPAEDEPRIITTIISSPEEIIFTDREYNVIKNIVPSHQIQRALSFTLCNCYAEAAAINDAKIRRHERKKAVKQL